MRVSCTVFSIFANRSLSWCISIGVGNSISKLGMASFLYSSLKYSLFLDEVLLFSWDM